MKSKGTNRSKTERSGSSSWLLRISWLFICLWILVLMYFWHSGFLHTSNNSTLLYLDKVLNKTEDTILIAEDNLRKRIKNIHIPKLDEIDFSPDIQTYASRLHQLNYNRGERYAIHIIFSTDCSAYQDWESLVIFYTATIVRQKGPITRIASGCDETKKNELTALYAKLYPHYHVHFTPDFKKDEKTQKSYDFYNKPWGLKHWLENAQPPVQDDCVISLIDPDFIFLRPLTLQVAHHPTNLYDKSLQSEMFDTIKEGKPVGQMYGLGAPWTKDNHLKFNRTFICGADSPCVKNTEQHFGELHYSVGPPYIVHVKDMIRIAKSWTDFVPRVYVGYPFLLAEMYAYSMAAAHEQLPHFQMEQHMVSNTDAGGEGWEFIDALNDPCTPPDSDTGIYFPNQKLPTYLHYCQNYMVSNIGFAKRRAPKDMFSCETPLFVELPKNYYSHAIQQLSHDEKLNPRIVKNIKRDAFMVCTLHRSINAAIIDYKTRMCHKNIHGNYPFVNMNYTINVLGGSGDR